MEVIRLSQMKTKSLIGGSFYVKVVIAAGCKVGFGFCCLLVQILLVDKESLC